MKKILIVILFFFLYNSSFAQEKKQLYFLADTVNINKGRKILEIKNDIEITYTFLCKCLYPNSKDVSFGVLTSKKSRATTGEMPNVQLTGLKDLLAIASKGSDFFEKNYELTIIEKVPSNRYRINKVRLLRYKNPSIDLQHIKPAHN